jgi:hypothetical protein
MARKPKLADTAQADANQLAAQLISISTHLANAANYSAATAHKLSSIANASVNLLDDAGPITDESLASLKGIATLTKLANEWSEIGVKLLRANKDAMDDLNRHNARDAAGATQATVAFYLPSNRRDDDNTSE